MRRAVTLIEMLMVVAVLSILVVIGVMNLMGAQDRARIAVVASDLRFLKTGLSAYHVDHNGFPPGPTEESISDYSELFVSVALTPLTTPVAYLSSLTATDPFTGAQALAPCEFSSFSTVLHHSYVYVHYADFALFKQNPNLWARGHCVASLGPDQVDSYGVYRPFPRELPAEARMLGISTVTDTVFDPTNGSRSGGDISQFGGSFGSTPSW